ncbi:MAG: DUF4340 domain-containing protein [Lysobacteraceae bacterium]|nr:MAG: DUF4340 domain-containing protein [Xanthomonadaceae bacterium]
MNRKTLIGLAVATAIALTIAVMLQFSQQPRSSDDEGRPSEALAPTLAGHVNDIDKLVVTGAGGKVIATLVRGDGGWTLQEKGGYAVDTGKLRAFLLKLADSKRLEPKTADAARHAALGVEDVAAADAKGVLVELGGLAQPLRLVVGESSTRGGNTFVRFADEAQSWLASGLLAPEETAADWLARDLVDIDAARVAQVELTAPDGSSVKVSKSAEGDADFALAGIPKGREAGSAYTINGLAGALDGVRFDDVLPAGEAPPPANARKARYATFDGVVIDAVAWEAEGKHYARFVAALDDARAASHAESAGASATTQASATGADADAKQNDAPAEGAPAAAPEPGSAPAKDPQARLAGVREEVASLQRRFDGWTFVVPAYKYAALDKSLEDLLKPVESAKPAAGKAGAKK